MRGIDIMLSGCVTAVKRFLGDTPSSLTKKSSLDQEICCDDKTTLHTSELLFPPNMVLRQKWGQVYI